MLTKEDNELVTNTNPGTPMGELLPALLAAGRAVGGAAGAGLRAGARHDPGREAHRLPRHGRPRRPGRRLLPAPRRAVVLRPQRGERPALRLPRLEVRRRPATASTCRTRRKATRTGTRSTSSRYPCVEAGGLIWAYMGPPDKQPPFPEFDWLQPGAGEPLRDASSSWSATTCRRWRATTTPATPASCTARWRTPRSRTRSTRRSSAAQQPDQRHRRAETPTTTLPARRRQPARGRQAASTELEDTDSGVICDRGDRDEPGGMVRANLQVTLSCCRSSARPASAARTRLLSNMRVPIDNESLMFFRLRWSYDPIPQEDLDRVQARRLRTTRS